MVDPIRFASSERQIGPGGAAKPDPRQRYGGLDEFDQAVTNSVRPARGFHDWIGTLRVANGLRRFVGPSGSVPDAQEGAARICAE